ncbi:MAG TPA: hypothetical protein ENJ18_06105 [Nannocystis exedens]|nr:hypothetical protein [Nannocystis exedens]
MDLELGYFFALGDPESLGFAGDTEGSVALVAGFVGDGGLSDRRAFVRKKLLRSGAGRSTLAVVVPVDLHILPPWRRLSVAMPDHGRSGKLVGGYAGPGSSRSAESGARGAPWPRRRLCTDIV